MYNAGVVECDGRLHDVTEQAASILLVQRPTLSDVIKQVLHALRSLHHNYEAVRLLKVVNETYHTLHVRRTLQQADLDRQASPTFLFSTVSTWLLLLYYTYSYYTTTHITYYT